LILLLLVDETILVDVPDFFREMWIISTDTQIATDGCLDFSFKKSKKGRSEW